METSAKSAPVSSQEIGMITKLLLKEGIISEQQLAYAIRVRSKLTTSKTMVDSLIDLGYLSHEVLQETLRNNRVSIRLGDFLVELGYLREMDLKQALGIQAESNVKQRLGEVLVDRGFIEDRKLLEALSYQMGYPLIELTFVSIDRTLLSIIPLTVCQELEIVPVRREESFVLLALSDPLDQKIHDCARKFLGDRVQFAIASKESIRTTLNALERSATQPLISDESTIIGIINTLLDDAILEGASDIHIEPMLDGYIVRYRTDGILQKVLEIPKKVESSVMSRLKVIAKLDIAEHRRPQDGHISLKYNEKTYDLRVSTLPVNQKEKMVVRVLAPDIKVQKGDVKLKLAGAANEDLEKIELMTNKPHGIILAVGPTGSGKTTTLYSVLNRMNNETINITTVEDPVEIKLDGISQVQVNPRADITFASCLRAILRQDPDVVMIGEIRDFETLEAAIHASITGHVVLSTLHTNSAAATVVRLTEMGAAAHLVATALEGIIAQRLVRRLCPECKQVYKPTDKELKYITSSEEDLELFKQKDIFKAVGCDSCNKSGFVGRMGIYEVLVVSREIKKMISKGAADHEIEETAVSCGMKTLQRGGLDAILNGEIPISEFIRVLGVVND